MSRQINASQNSRVGPTGSYSGLSRATQWLQEICQRRGSISAENPASSACNRPLDSEEQRGNYEESPTDGVDRQASTSVSPHEEGQASAFEERQSQPRQEPVQQGAEPEDIIHNSSSTNSIIPDPEEWSAELNYRLSLLEPNAEESQSSNNQDDMAGIVDHQPIRPLPPPAAQASASAPTSIQPAAPGPDSYLTVQRWSSRQLRDWELAMVADEVGQVAGIGAEDAANVSIEAGEENRVAMLDAASEGNALQDGHRDEVEDLEGRSIEDWSEGVTDFTDALSRQREQRLTRNVHVHVTHTHAQRTNGRVRECLRRDQAEAIAQDQRRQAHHLFNRQYDLVKNVAKIGNLNMKITMHRFDNVLSTMQEKNQIAIDKSCKNTEEALIMKVMKALDERDKRCHDDLLSKMYNNICDPVRETVEKQLETYMNCEKQPPRELSRIHHTQTLTRLRWQKKQVEKELHQLRAEHRCKLGVDSRKLARLDHEQHPDDFSEDEAKAIAYMTIERLFPGRPKNLQALLEWEQRLYRQIYKCLRVPIDELNENKEAATWLKPLLSRIDQITPMRRIKLGLNMRCSVCRMFFSSERKKRYHQRHCKNEPMKAFLDLPDSLPTVNVAKDQDLHNIVHFDHKVTFCEVPTCRQMKAFYRMKMPVGDRAHANSKQMLATVIDEPVNVYQNFTCAQNESPTKLKTPTKRSTSPEKSKATPSKQQPKSPHAGGQKSGYQGCDESNGAKQLVGKKRKATPRKMKVTPPKKLATPCRKQSPPSKSKASPSKEKATSANSVRTPMTRSQSKQMTLVVDQPSAGTGPQECRVAERAEENIDKEKKHIVRYWSSDEKEKSEEKLDFEEYIQKACWQKVSYQEDLNNIPVKGKTNKQKKVLDSKNGARPNLMMKGILKTSKLENDKVKHDEKDLNEDKENIQMLDDSPQQLNPTRKLFKDEPKLRKRDKKLQTKENNSLSKNASKTERFPNKYPNQKVLEKVPTTEQYHLCTICGSNFKYKEEAFMHIGERHSLQEAEEFGLEYVYAASCDFTNKPLYNFKCKQTGLTIPTWNLNNHMCNYDDHDQDGLGPCGDVFERMRLALDKVSYTKVGIMKDGLTDTQLDPIDFRNHLIALEEFENMATVARMACYIARRRLNHNFPMVVGDQFYQEILAGHVADKDEDGDAKKESEESSEDLSQY